MRHGIHNFNEVLSYLEACHNNGRDCIVTVKINNEIHTVGVRIIDTLVSGVFFFDDCYYFSLQGLGSEVYCDGIRLERISVCIVKNCS